MSNNIQMPECAGSLVEVEVPGQIAGAPNPENEVDIAEGKNRTMFVYAPASGCLHPKQTQVLYVYRDDATKESAQELLDSLGIIEIAEREHCLVILPNPYPNGWNYKLDAERDSDAAFFVRCFAATKPALGVAGFNGMMFHLATTPASSAAVWNLALKQPMDCAAVMLGAFPEDYVAPEAELAQQVVWLYEPNAVASSWLARCDAPAKVSQEVPEQVINTENPCVTYFEHADGLSQESVAAAWDAMFAQTRRWRNDVQGTFQARTDFSNPAFTFHDDDTSLGLEDGIARSWVEYVPKRVAASTDPVPLVFYFHGINCMGRYGVEQSGWADIAERDGFIAVFPDATIEQRWNGWFDDRLPSDVDFVMALIEHMNEIHPIDCSRIYLSGFSMGSMFSNALAAAFPEKFAGVVACNGPMMTYAQTLDEAIPGTLMMQKAPALVEIRDYNARSEDVTPLHKLADAKWAKLRYKMPFVQFIGLIDNVGFKANKTCPITSDDESFWGPTVSFWKAANGAEPANAYGDTETGFVSDNLSVEGSDERFYHQSWTSPAGESLYHVVGVRRMPHAVDLRAIELGWKLVSAYSRNEDGTLNTRESE